jgi:hypothetical protein
MTRLKKDIERSIRQLIEDYRENELSYLTESDVVASLLGKLRERLGSDYVHCELRPYDVEGKFISGKPRKWSKDGRGSLVDIAVIRKHQLKATIKEKRRKYWRYLSFPVESFTASIEVKIRTWRNKRNIRPDVDKLRLIKEANPDCLVYLLVLDRKASPEDIGKVRDYAKENHVGFFSYPN